MHFQSRVEYTDLEPPVPRWIVSVRTQILNDRPPLLSREAMSTSMSQILDGGPRQYDDNNANNSTNYLFAATKT
jgi:hypothetical protein